MSKARGTVFKRGDSYVVVLDLGRDGNGKRIRKWHSGYADEAEAEVARSALLNALDKGSYVERKELTVGGYFQGQWLPLMKRRVRATTMAMYVQNINAHIIPALGSVQLQALTASRLDAFYSDLLDHGRKDGKGGLSTRSVRIIHVILHKAFHDALRKGLIERNPVPLADPPPVKSKETAVWSPEQLQAFLESQRDDRLAALWRLEASTGMRRGEICGLRWSDIDLDGATLRVRQTIVEVNYQLQFSEPKTEAGKRRLALDPTTVARLKAHKARQATERLSWGALWTGADADLVFTKEDGSPIHPERLTRWFDQRVAAAKMPRITFHGLRHTYVTMLLRGGQPVRQVSARVGHASANVTNAIYSHVLPGDDEQLAIAGAALLVESVASSH